MLIAALALGGAFLGQRIDSEEIFRLQLASYLALRDLDYAKALDLVNQTYPLYPDKTQGLTGSAFLEARALIGLGKLDAAGEAFKKGLYWDESRESFSINGHYFESWVIGFYCPEYAEYLARVGRDEDAKMVLIAAKRFVVGSGVRFSFDKESFPYSLSNLLAACYVMKAQTMSEYGPETFRELESRDLLHAAIRENCSWFLPQFLLANNEPLASKRRLLLEKSLDFAKRDNDREMVRLALEAESYNDFEKKYSDMAFSVQWNKVTGEVPEYERMSGLALENWERVATKMKPK